ncbi:MAG: 2-succinyl-5-enolpyruvyl-6-hydroxy-3-cyclohexene-1-carboxylate synthase, partial [Rhodothermales bacterium]
FGRSSINYGVARAREGRGPVHLNCCFREPFLPATIPGPPTPSPAATTYSASERRLAPAAYEELLSILANARRPCLLIGELRNEAERQAVLEFQLNCGWLALPDITSGLRLGTRQPGFCHYYDLLLSHAEFASGFCPDVLLQVGGRMTSKGLAEHLQMRSPQHHVLLSSQPGRQDPEHGVSMRVSADSPALLQKLSAETLPVSPDARVDIDSVLDDAISAHGLCEASVARELPRLLRPDQALLLGASMPIRAIDILGASDGPRVAVAANRGASGIDGTLATAFGYAHAAGKPTVVFLGDLTLLHDLNSLHLISQSSQPIQVIVINNDGGGIFSFLPIAEQDAVFEPWFGTPHGRNFQEIAAGFSLSYARPDDLAEFAATLAAGTQLIEVSCSREKNVAIHQALRQAVGQLNP